MKAKKVRTQRISPVSPMSKAMRAMSEIYPYKAITDSGFLIDRNDGYQALLRVRTTDLKGADDTELGLIIERLKLVFRAYEKPFKILSTTYKTNTSEQQQFWKSKVQSYRRMLAGAGLSTQERAALNCKLELAMDEAARHTWVEAELEEQAFFFVLYDRTEKLIKDDVERVIGLGDRSLGLVHINDKTEIEQLVFRLCNMNT